MKKSSLLKTNPYLADPQKRKYLLKNSVLSSTAIEGVHAAAERALGLKKSTKVPSPSQKSGAQHS